MTTPATLNEPDTLLPQLRDDDAVRWVAFAGNAASGSSVRHFSVEELARRPGDADGRGLFAELLANKEARSGPAGAPPTPAGRAE